MVFHSGSIITDVAAVAFLRAAVYLYHFVWLLRSNSGHLRWWQEEGEIASSLTFRSLHLATQHCAHRLRPPKGLAPADWSWASSAVSWLIFWTLVCADVSWHDVAIALLLLLKKYCGNERLWKACLFTQKCLCTSLNVTHDTIFARSYVFRMTQFYFLGRARQGKLPLLLRPWNTTLIGFYLTLL